MTVSRELKAKRLALVEEAQSPTIRDNAGEMLIKNTSYEENFLYFLKHSELDILHDTLHREVTADQVTSLEQLQYESINYNFSKESAFYTSKSNDQDTPYHTVKHGIDGILRGEISLGEIGFKECYATPVIKYSKNLVTGEYDFSETETELIGIDAFTSSATSVSLKQEALLPLLEIMINIMHNGLPKITRLYEGYQERQRLQEQAQKEKGDLDILF